MPCSGRTSVKQNEYFAPGQKGSSAMPHKRNPITCEKICGLARVLRGNAQAALENVHFGMNAIFPHSSVERIILPDSTILLDHMLRKMTNILDKLLVYPDAMIRNLNKTGGLIFSQNLLVALVGKGVLREDAYKWVQRNAMARWLEGLISRPTLKPTLISKNTSRKKKLKPALNPSICLSILMISTPAMGCKI